VARLAAMIRGDRPIAAIVGIVFVIDLGFVLLHVGHILSSEKSGWWRPSAIPASI